jgi:mono/diheme cytochrome c family protein
MAPPSSQRPPGKFALGLAAGALCLLLLLAAVGLGVVYTGAYNVAATEEHSSLGRWVFDTTFHRSVKARAAELEPPSNLGAMVERGAGEYKAMCQHCHGGPGVERDEWASGMRPRPPHLTESAAQWRPREVFWLAKHGAKMSGMPAFGPTHDDEALWSIAAMVKELPAMTPERYAALGHEHGEAESGHH